MFETYRRFFLIPTPHGIRIEHASLRFSHIAADVDEARDYIDALIAGAFPEYF